MRRILIASIASAFVLAAAPGAALAQHHSGKHKGHHHRMHTKKFGSDAPTQPGGSSSSSDTAGTVASFSGGVLTIKLTDGSMVSGKVTGDTEIECQAPETQETALDEDGPSSGEHNPGEQAGGNDNEATENEDQNEQEDEMVCGTAALTPGTVVQEAELRVSSSGATWKQVELQK